MAQSFTSEYQSHETSKKRILIVGGVAGGATWQTKEIWHKAD